MAINEQSPSKELSKKGWLDYLFYKEGKQNSNFYVCGTYGKRGERKFTKWKNYLESVAIIDLVSNNNSWEEKSYFEGINQRQILPHELVLDIEEPERVNPIVEKIKEWDGEGGGLRWFVFETGSRGFHIHLFFKEDFTTEEKEAIVKSLDTDIQKCSEKNLIALEFCPHWKTGKLKQQVKV